MLHTDRATLEARLRARGGRFDAQILEDLDELHAGFLELDWSRWLMIDSSNLTADEVAARILSEL